MTKVVPRIYNPPRQFFEDLKPPLKEMALDLIGRQAIVMNEDFSSFFKGISHYFDDISFDTIQFPWTHGRLYRVGYGVGGGNFGDSIYLADSKNQITLVASSFDGVPLQCNKKFMDKIIPKKKGPGCFDGSCRAK